MFIFTLNYASLRKKVKAMTSKQDFSDNLRHLCAERGTVSHICREIGINRQQFDRYLKGETLPAAHNMRRIAIYFQIPESELLEPHTVFIRKHMLKTGFSNRSPLNVLATTFSGQSRSLRRYEGFYHVYVTSPSWEGKILRCLTQIYEQDGYILCKTLQRVTSRDRSIRQRAKFEGLVTYRGTRIFVIEKEEGDEGGIVETILLPAQRQKVNYLRGLTLGVASRPRYTPYFSKTIWKRISETTSLREALVACGAYDSTNRKMDATVRNFLDGPAQSLLM